MGAAMIDSNASQVSTSSSSADESICSNRDLQVRIFKGRDGTTHIDHQLGHVRICRQRVCATFNLVDRTLIGSEFISWHNTDITCVEDGRQIINRVIEHEMNGTSHVTVEPDVRDQRNCVTYYEAGHVDVTVEKPFNNDVYRVTVDTPHLNVVATADQCGKYKVDFKLLDGKGNILWSKNFQDHQFACSQGKT